MKKNLILALTLSALAVFGCGGGGSSSGTKNSTISGRVTFPDGTPARDVSVVSADAVVQSSTNGAFILTGVRAADQIIKASVTEAGVEYVGQNLARTYNGEQAASINIMIVPKGQTASIRGTVKDRDGNVLESASVFALGSNALSSSRDLTDKFGRFQIDNLLAGVSYEVSAGGATYRSDYVTTSLVAGENKTINFTLTDPADKLFVPPSDLTAIAWTSFASRDRAYLTARDNLKREFDPKHFAKQTTRLSPLGNPIEVEIEWTPIQSDDVLGWGIYRGINGAAVQSIDFYREPLSGLYVDSATKLTVNQDYSYAVTALNTNYPDTANSESDFSNVTTIRPMPDLVLRSTSQGPLTFKWNAVTGAENYIVYVYDQYPGYNVDSIWNNSSNRSTGTEKVYDGSVPLTVGNTYYFLVLGLSQNDNSRTISEVGAFVYQN